MAHGLLVRRLVHTTPRDRTLLATFAACAASLSMGCGGPALHSPTPPPPPPSAPALQPIAAPETPQAPATTDAPPSFGTFASTGGLLGAWEASPGYCQLNVMAKDGQTVSGVMFTRRLGEFHPSLTAMATSKGTAGVVVEVGNPSRMLALKAKQCARLEVEIPGRAGGTSADVEIDCDAGEGARVRASLHAASCH